MLNTSLIAARRLSKSILYSKPSPRHFSIRLTTKSIFSPTTPINRIPNPTDQSRIAANCFIRRSHSEQPKGVVSESEETSEERCAAGVSMSDITSSPSVAGDVPSKNARKKEEKMKKKEEERLKKEEEKRKKEAATGAAQPKKTQEADDDDMDPTQYFENRLKALAAQKEAGLNPYPHKFHVDMTVPE